MNLAWISIGALILAVGLSCTTAVNVGVLAMALAWLVGVYLGACRSPPSSRAIRRRCW